MKNIVFILCTLFTAAGPLSASETAAPAAAATPVMELLKAWSPVEAALAERAPLGQDLRSTAVAFKQSLERFISTPLYAEFAGKGLIESREDILALAGGLSSAVEAGNIAETVRAAAVIREKLFSWQSIELRASGRLFCGSFGFLSCLF